MKVDGTSQCPTRFEPELAPHEIAIDTLNTLKDFTADLLVLTSNLASGLPSGQSSQDFETLIDGIGLLVDSIVEVKKLFRMGFLAETDPLETELLSIFRQMLTENKVEASLRIPEHLVKWRDTGLPALLKVAQESAYLVTRGQAFSSEFPVIFSDTESI